ncbi:S8 family serine peptidase [Methanolobus halotolerans]|uniref:Subtilisin n=1 Tax=Methanolobus halotolerans TaxID=2052935 RepID=A0A4E0Q582_9EURY|nr:S8 family serine peptidase [Methanolobus halotolerans]TGC09205.1 subtilisin [Methanolobus halotolerans]
MTRKTITILIVLAILLSLSSMTASAKTNENEKVPVLITFKGTTDADLVKAHGGNVKYEYTIIPSIAAELPQKAIEALSKNPNIGIIEPDLQGQILEDEIPWGISRINADSAQTIGFNGSGTTIGVVDSGIDYNHADLAANYLGGYDFVNNDADPMDDNGHGTHVAGTIAAADNGFGVVGAAPGAGLYALKAVDETGYCSYSDIIAAINWAVDNDVDVITMSLGGTGYSSTLKNACDHAYANGIVIVAAAGNYNSEVIYPAAYDSVIAVSATDYYDNKASWSCYGPEIELAAPGVSIKSTLLGGSYGSKSGTSMAAPHVTGAVSLLLCTDVAGTVYDTDSDGKWDPAEIRSRLHSTATDLGTTGKDDYYGYGLVNAFAAVDGLSLADPEENAPEEPLADPEEDDSTTSPETPEFSEPSMVMYVSSLEVTTDLIVRGRKNYFVWGEAEMRIVDINGNNVEGATVTGDWSGLVSKTVSGVTDANGMVVISSDHLKNPEGEFIFTVTDVSLDGYEYDSSENLCSTDSAEY